MPSIDIIFINLQAIKETFLTYGISPLSQPSIKINLSIVTDCSIKEPLSKEINWLGLKNWLC